MDSSSDEFIMTVELPLFAFTITISRVELRFFSAKNSSLERLGLGSLTNLRGNHHGFPLLHEKEAGGL